MKETVAVIFGGRTAEHDVSIITGNQAMENADKDKYDIVPIYISREGEWFTGGPLMDVAFYKRFDARAKGVIRVFVKPYSNVLFADGRKVKPYAEIDVAILAMHGLNGEDGTLQGLLELSGIPYTSAGVVGSAAGMDKIVMKAAFEGFGFPVLPACYFERAELERDKQAAVGKAEEEIGYPMFVKPANLGSSIGISKAESREKLDFALDVAANFDSRIIVEKAVEDIMEVNCAVLGSGSDCEVSVTEQPVVWDQFLTFDEKYLRSEANKGMKAMDRKMPAPLSETMEQQVQRFSKEIFRLFHLKGVVRIDYIVDRSQDKLYVNEINTIPGSFAYYLFEPKGISFKRLIDRLITTAKRQAEEKKKSSFSYDSKILERNAKGAKSGEKQAF